jgi:flagellar biosynthesis/type III secretory pathway M-ring protein FliF/YscJ
MFLLPLGKKSGKLLNRVLDANQENVVLIVVLMVVVFMIFGWLMTEGHVKLFYGKYAKEIKKVIDELKEE